MKESNLDEQLTISSPFDIASLSTSGIKHLSLEFANVNKKEKSKILKTLNNAKTSFESISINNFDLGDPEATRGLLSFLIKESSLIKIMFNNVSVIGREFIVAVNILPFLKTIIIENTVLNSAAHYALQKGNLDLVILDNIKVIENISYIPLNLLIFMPSQSKEININEEERNKITKLKEFMINKFIKKEKIDYSEFKAFKFYQQTNKDILKYLLNTPTKETDDLLQTVDEEIAKNIFKFSGISKQTVFTICPIEVVVKLAGYVDLTNIEDG